MSWLDDYIDYTKTQESPEIFHRWCGITTIASVLARKVWLPRISGDGFERYRTRPGRLMVVLVAGSGSMRKSTSVDLAEELMRESGVRLFTGKITPERLLTKLGSFEDAQAVMTVIASELSVLLSKQQYAEPMINIITKLSDGKDDEYETQKTKVTLKDICLTMLMATTPSSLGKSIPEEAHEHGFMSRFLFIYGEDSEKIESLGTREEDIDDATKRRIMHVRSKLIMNLKEFGRLRGPFRWETEANKWYNDWYDKYKKSEESKGPGWPARRPEHMIRIGLILSVSDHNIIDSTKLMLYNDSLQKADAYISEAEKGFDKAFAYIGRHSNAEIQRRIISCFKNGVTITDEEIYYKCLEYVSDGRALRLVIDSMQTAGILKMVRFDASANERTWALRRDKL